jgi:hypothetical protein
MSITEPQQTLSASTEVRGPATTGSFRERFARETKPSFATTEFWAMLAGVVAIAVIYNVSHDPSLNLFRASLLATLIAVAYMASRGLAKAGSRDERVFDDEVRRRY